MKAPLPVALTLTICIMSLGAGRREPSYALAYVIMADVRGGPPGNEHEVPESTAYRLKLEADVLLNTDSILVVSGAVEDSASACTDLPAGACDFVFVREQVSPADSAGIVVTLEVRNKRPARHKQTKDEPPCDTARYSSIWRKCRELHLRDFAKVLQEHVAQQHTK